MNSISLGVYMDNEALGHEAKRRAVPHSQADVAEALGTSQPTIGRAYRGHATEWAIRIIEHFGGYVEGPHFRVLPRITSPGSK